MFFQVMYRDQTYGLPGEGEGSGWTKVYHKTLYVDFKKTVVRDVLFLANMKCNEWIVKGILLVAGKICNMF
jgi:hypothetical protein